MASTLDRMEQTVVLECLRGVRKRLGFGTAQALAAKISNINMSIPEETALRLVNGNSVDREFYELIANSALSIIHQRRDSVISHYESSNKYAAEFISHILDKYEETEEENAIRLQTIDSTPPETVVYADSIFDSWRHSFKKGNLHLRTGIYQIFRRYKSASPVVASPNSDNKETTSYETTAVVCEMLYVASESMEFVLITNERNIYFGTMFINHENILFGIAQRRCKTNGVNYRFIALKLEGSRLPMYSGLCLKVGDKTLRPLTSECLFVKVPASSGSDLYKEIENIKARPWRGEYIRPIDRSSIISDYLTDSPPAGPYNPDDPAWQRVKFINEFPQLLELAQPSHEGKIYFRDPSRTLSVETIMGLTARGVLKPFRHSTSPVSKSPAPAERTD